MTSTKPEAAAAPNAPIYRGHIALSVLPPGAIDETDDEWMTSFDSAAVYPPIQIQMRDHSVHIINGNHRRIVWGRHGYKYAPAFVIDEWDRKQ